jgi:hypothetical protein
MRVDELEATWDASKNKWLLRIRTGEEVLRRYCSAPKDADEETLRNLSRKTLQDEGYEPDPVEMKIRR